MTTKGIRNGINVINIDNQYSMFSAFNRDTIFTKHVLITGWYR